jgi:hypothetical protein
MRLAIVGVCFSLATAAFCQSSTPAPVKPEGQPLNQPSWAQPSQDLNVTPRNFRLSTVPQGSPFLPRPESETQIELKTIGPREVDPEMVMHPPQSSLGEQAPGTQVAQNLYPGLTLLPIQESKAKTQPIPIAWPDAPIKNIPIIWPKATVTPVENSPKPGK